MSLVRATLALMRNGHDDPAVPLTGYELRERLGAGRRGEVWWAVELATGDDVALRWLPQPADIDDRGRLVVAAEALTGLSHPHLLRVRAVVSAVSDLVLVCDLVRGGSLGDLLDRRGALEPGEAVTVLVPLAQVLAALHADGVAVGAVGEHDVLLTEEGRPLLGDVGLDTLQAAATGAAPSSSDPADDVRGLAALAERMLLPLSDAAAPDAKAAGAEAGGAEVGVTSETVSSAARQAVLAVTRPALDPRPEHRPSAAELGDALLDACPPVPLRGVTRRQLRSPQPPGDAGPLRPKLARPEPVPPAPPPRLSDRSPAVRRILVGVAAVALLGAAVVTGVSWAGHGSPPAAAPLQPLPSVASPAPSTAASPAAEDRSTPRAAGTPGATSTPRAASTPGATSTSRADPPPTSGRAPATRRWARLLRELDATRAQAFALGDRAALRTVYVNESPAHRRDAEGLRRLVRAGLRVRGLRLTDIRVTDARQRSDGEVVLRVSDRMAPYDVVTASGEVRRHEPGRGRAAWRVTLARGGPAAAWRIRDVQR
jgi:hypothetical protein